MKVQFSLPIVEALAVIDFIDELPAGKQAKLGNGLTTIADALEEAINELDADAGEQRRTVADHSNGAKGPA